MLARGGEQALTDVVQPPADVLRAERRRELGSVAGGGAEPAQRRGLADDHTGGAGEGAEEEGVVVWRQPSALRRDVTRGRRQCRAALVRGCCRESKNLPTRTASWQGGT